MRASNKHFFYTLDSKRPVFTSSVRGVNASDSHCGHGRRNLLWTEINLLFGSDTTLVKSDSHPSILQIILELKY